MAYALGKPDLNSSDDVRGREFLKQNDRDELAFERVMIVRVEDVATVRVTLDILEIDLSYFLHA